MRRMESRMRRKENGVRSADEKEDDEEELEEQFDIDSLVNEGSKRVLKRLVSEKLKKDS